MTQPALINNYLHVKAPNRALADCNFSKFYGEVGIISWLLFHTHMECWLVLTINIQILINFEPLFEPLLPIVQLLVGGIPNDVMHHCITIVGHIKRGKLRSRRLSLCS